MEKFKRHFNLNTLLLAGVLGLLKFEAGRLYNKIDMLETSYVDLAQRIARLEGAAGLTGPPPAPPVIKPKTP